MLAVSCII